MELKKWHLNKLFILICFKPQWWKLLFWENMWRATTKGTQSHWQRTALHALTSCVTQFCRFRVNQLFSHFGHLFTSTELLGADFHKKNGLNRLFFAWQWAWMRPTLHENTPYSSAAADEAIATRAMCAASMESSSSRGFSPCLWMKVFVPESRKSPPNLVNKL